jgi:outer membrane protein TolC
MMQFIKSRHIPVISFLLVLNTNVLAKELLLEPRLEVLDITSKQNEADANKLKTDWLNPIIYKYAYSNGDNLEKSTKKSTLAINQPIFRSGGIWAGIRYANNIKTTSDTTVYIQKKELVKKAFNIVLNIKKTDLQIRRQDLSIDNSIIDVKIKKQNVFNGLLDISTLNNAIIAKNAIKEGLLDLTFQKNSLINSLKNLSSLEYQNIQIPALKMISQEEFKTNNTYIKQSTTNIQTKKNLKSITSARYLPSFNVNYTKTLDHGIHENSDLYGFNITVPLDYKGLQDTKSSKFTYLKAKEELKITKLEEITFLNIQELKIKLLQDKISLTKQNIVVYNDLLEQTQELAQVGIKTVDDVKVLDNSQQKESLNIDIYKLEEQIELLEIYARIQDDKI